MQHDKFMRRCLQLASYGSGFVAPNPMVGCVIVCNDKVIGEGYHKHFGGPHAEVNAFARVEQKELLSEATVYVSLEPCSHQGKTPPCADLLVSNNIKRVVIGCRDSNPVVGGKGIERLKRAGIEVIEGVLEEECRQLNKRFFTFYERRRPYVVLKWAQTLDGFIDRVRNEDIKGINWVSSELTKTLVHKWRSEEQSILVGRNTIINDNPSLTNILEELYKREISSVFVEGGSRTLQYFIIDNVWDEARVIVGNTKFGDGIKAPIINRIPTDSFKFGEDRIYIYFRK